LPGRFVLPGLVDAHCHLSIGTDPEGRPTGLPVDQAREKLIAARSAGVTGIRDTGSPGSVTLQLLADPAGADLVLCGRFLAPDGCYFPALHDPVPAGQLVDAAVAELAGGARWIKLVGDFPPLESGQPSGPAAPTYPVEVVRRLVDAVHAAGGRVAAHTTTRHVAELIAAGIDSVEHGTELAEADLPALAARGGAWTPTLCASFGGPVAEPDPERARRRAERRELLGQLLPRAAALGVTVLTGTDVVGSIPREVALLVELGLPAPDALAAASTAARRFLGLPGLTDGAPANLVSYEADPRDDPAVLAEPAAVLVRGIRVR
jgi:imidazolonepropionase-like amidohydrolase